MNEPPGKRQQGGPLEGHYRVGKTFSSPLTALPVSLVDFLRDDVPDLLWPIVLFGERGHEGFKDFAALQDSIADALARRFEEPSRAAFDGRLSSLSRFGDAERAIVSSFVQDAAADSAFLVEPLAAGLGLYSEVPGSWIFPQQQYSEDDVASGLAMIARSIFAVVTDPHLSALVRVPALRWQLLTGSLSLPTDFADDLQGYPFDEDTRSEVDSLVRAAFQATSHAQKLLGPEASDSSLEWARSFWRQGWDVSECSLGAPEERTVAGESSPSDSGELHAEKSGPTGNINTTAADFAAGILRELERDYQGFLHDVFGSDMGPDLFSPARHEVVCGLVARSSSIAAATLKYPTLWSGQQGAYAMRTLTENLIRMEWMRGRGGDVYERYQDYGQGKRKLMKANLEVIRSSEERGNDDGLEKLIERIGSKFDGAMEEELSEVNVGAFGGVSLRSMANTAGLEAVHKLIYQPASSTTHSEWHTLEDYEMHRCGNPLHRFHWVPRARAFSPPSQEYGPSLLKAFRHLLGSARASLRDVPSVDA